MAQRLPAWLGHARRHLAALVCGRRCSLLAAQIYVLEYMRNPRRTAQISDARWEELRLEQSEVREKLVAATRAVGDAEQACHMAKFDDAYESLDLEFQLGRPAHHQPQ